MKSTTSYGFVYLIACQGINRVKIGYSADPNKRLKELSTGAPGQLVLLATWRGTQKHEAMLHKHLDKYRSQLEWFEIDAHLAMQHVTKMMAGDCPIVPTTKEMQLESELADARNLIKEYEEKQKEWREYGERVRGKYQAAVSCHSKFKASLRRDYWFFVFLFIMVTSAAFVCGTLYKSYMLGVLEREIRGEVVVIDPPRTEDRPAKSDRIQ